MKFERKYINQDYTDDPIICAYRRSGLICPKIATVHLYGKELSGYYCDFHAEEIIRRYYQTSIE